MFGSGGGGGNLQAALSFDVRFFCHSLNDGLGLRTCSAAAAAAAPIYIHVLRILDTENSQAAAFLEVGFRTIKELRNYWSRAGN